jgi:hypothetical protein
MCFDMIERPPFSYATARERLPGSISCLAGLPRLHQNPEHLFSPWLPTTITFLISFSKPT